MFGWRETAQAQLEIIDELRATIAAQETQIDQLTRSVAACRLIAKSMLRRPGIETR
jgi:uncharacterized coiled-coil protein SlyX